MKTTFMANVSNIERKWYVVDLSLIHIQMCIRDRVYAQQTKPLVEYYQDRGLYTEIDGRQAIDKVLTDIVASLRSEQDDHPKV